MQELLDSIMFTKNSLDGFKRLETELLEGVDIDDPLTFSIFKALYESNLTMIVGPMSSYYELVYHGGKVMRIPMMDLGDSHDLVWGLADAIKKEVGTPRAALRMLESFKMGVEGYLEDQNDK